MQESKPLGVIVIGDYTTALGVIRSLGRRSIPVYLINDKSSDIAIFSRYTKRFIKSPDIENEYEFVDFIIKVSEDESVDGWILIPTNDVAVGTISKNKRKLEEYYEVPVPDWDIIKYAYNKRLTYITAKELGIPIPQTICPKNLEELQDMLSEIRLPTVIKPAIMHKFYKKTKVKVFKASTKEELLHAYIKASSIIDPSEIIIQEMIPGGPNCLYSFGSFFRCDELVATCIAKRSRQRPMDFGTASTFVESMFIPELKEFGLRLLKAINYYGLSEIEFMKDPRTDEYKLIEMNPRPWGWHTLTAKCGVDLPYLMYKDICDGNVEPIATFKENVKWMHIVTDLSVAITEVLKGNMKIKHYLASLRGEKEFAVLSSDDPLPFIAEILMLPYLWLTR